MRLKFTAPKTHRLFPEGRDGDAVYGGEEFTVTAELGERLLATMPDLEVAAGELNSLTRAELDELALTAGLDPTDFKTKGDVIAALSKNDEPEAAGEGHKTESKESEK